MYFLYQVLSLSKFLMLLSFITNNFSGIEYIKFEIHHFPSFSYCPYNLSSQYSDRSILQREHEAQIIYVHEFKP